MPFTPAAVKALLSPLGFEVGAERDGSLAVRVPGFRSYDVRREVDLIEEIARTHGYDAFPADLGPYRVGSVPDHPLFALEDELRAALAGRGLFEAHTPAFAPEGEGDVEVSNPLSTTERYMRSSLVPGLLRRIEHNFAHGNRDVRLFEIGTSFRKRGSGQQPREATCLAAVLTGSREPAHWSGSAEPFAVWDLKSLLEDVARRAYSGSVEIVPGCEDPRFDASAAFTLTGEGGAALGRGGRVAEGTVDTPVWAGPLWALELELPAGGAVRAAATYEPLPAFPPVDRDLALLVPEGVAAATVSAAIIDAAGKLLEEISLFDVYTGEGIAAGKRSLAFRLRFRSAERTLKDAEVDEAVSSVVERLEEEMGVERRG